MYQYDKFGNLARRTNDNYWVGKRFKYDELNRLAQSKVTYQGQDYISDIVYDDNNYGSIKSKTAAYVGAPAIIHADYGTNGRPYAIAEADIPDGAFPTNKLSTEYNSFDKVSQITQYDDDDEIDRTLSYNYGYDHQRILMTESENLIVTKVKRYVGNCEYSYDHGTNRSFTYLSGPLGLFAVYEQQYEFDQVTYEQIHYIFTDHLGSITTIVNDKGVVEQELSYDAWGNLRDATTWSSPFTGTPMLDRGFTGHEHLYGFGLINMNGRMYDPVLGSFLSPDNYIQSPENSQSFNRYAYCLNNPLRYVDPDGEWFITGGLSFGKRSDGSIGINGCSVGVNFGMVGCGINVGFGSKGIESFGVYGEVGPHIGCVGLNASVNLGYNWVDHSTSIGLSANYGISLGGVCTLGAGINGFCSYSANTSKYSAGVGGCLGFGFNSDIWGGGIGASISRCDGQTSYGVGLYGHLEMPQEVYDFGVSDNPQKIRNYCVPGTLEEICKALGIDFATVQYWVSLRTKLMYGQWQVVERDGFYQFERDSYFAYSSPESREELINTINSTGWASSEAIIANAESLVESLINAYKAGQKVIACTNYLNSSGFERAHTVPVSVIKVYSNSYRIYFAETSPVRQVPVYTNSVKGSPTQTFKYCTFQLHR